MSVDDTTFYILAQYDRELARLSPILQIKRLLQLYFNDKEIIMKVEATEACIELIKLLKSKHGELMFHQSGGCCDGSSPMCYPLGEFKVGDQDVLIGEIAGCPFYMGKAQHTLWQNTDLTIDVVNGRGASFSLEIPEGKRFIVRSEVCKI